MVVYKLKKIFTEFSLSVAALILGLVIAALLILAYGKDPILAYKWLFYGGFGNYYTLLDTLSYAMPLMLTGVTFAIGVKAGLFNIGAEGQAYMGAIGAVIAGALIPRLVSLPGPLILLLVVVTSMIFGMLWSLGPALLKIYKGVHEVISTIMFNWIAYYLAMYLATHPPLVDPHRSEKTLSIVPEGRFPLLYPEKSILTAAVFISIAFCIAIYLFLTMTKAGFELRLVGANPDAARYAGINQRRTILMSFLIGGLAAGLAGGLTIAGRPPVWALYGTLGNIAGIGFDGIGVALIGRNNPIGAIIAAIFIGGLWNGSRVMEPYSGVASELSRAINGLIIVMLSIPELWRIIGGYVRRVKRGE